MYPQPANALHSYFFTIGERFSGSNILTLDRTYEVPVNVDSGADEHLYLYNLGTCGFVCIDDYKLKLWNLYHYSVDCYLRKLVRRTMMLDYLPSD